MTGSRWSMLRRISAKVFMRVLNSNSSSSSPEKRDFSYRARNSVDRDGGVMRLRESRWEMYSRRPIVAGRWSNPTVAASGIGGSEGSKLDGFGSGSKSGSGGARETALASIRWGNSRITG